MNILSAEKRRNVIAALVEGVSINGVVRMTGVSKPTILKLLADLGTACAKYQDEKLRTWTALDADTKLMISWLVGDRSADTATVFIKDVVGRLANRIQLTTDGHKAYLVAVADAFDGISLDYAMLTKLYKEPPTEGNEKRYSPGVCCGVRKDEIRGDPDPKHISTSYAERMNLQIRMGMRRFTRLTNAHSKKIENHNHALALYFLFYNFARIHSTLRVTPAMEAGISDHVWSLEEIVGLLD